MTIEVMTSQLRTPALGRLTSPPATPAVCAAFAIGNLQFMAFPQARAGELSLAPTVKRFADYLCGLTHVDLPVCLLCHSVSRRMALSSRSVGHEL